MSADWVHIYVRYRNKTPDEEWPWKKLKAADYLGLCCLHDRAEPEQLFRALKPNEVYQQCKEAAVGSIECLNRHNRSARFEEFEADDISGNYEKIRNNIVNGLREFFPDILFEAHCIVQWGDTIDNFWIYDGDRLYGKSYEIGIIESEITSAEDDFSQDVQDLISEFLHTARYPADLDEDTEEEWDSWWAENYVASAPTENDPYPVPETYVTDGFYFGRGKDIHFWYLAD